MNLVSVFTDVSKIAQANPILSGIVGLYGAGVVTFLLRNVPTKIFAFIRRHLTTTVSIANVHDSYYRLMSVLDADGLVNRLRVIKFNNGKWGGGRVQKGIGIGRHVFWYRKCLIFADLQLQQNTDMSEKLTLTLTKWGRSHVLFDEIRREISKDEEIDVNKTKFYKFSDSWNLSMVNPSRKMDSIILSSRKVELLERTVSKFIQDEQWYLDHGIPYQLGILLYGPPGTGKTSIIKALAHKFGYSIAILPTDKITRLQDSICYLPRSSFLVIEDIDSAVSTHQRDDNSKGPVANNPDPRPKDQFLEDFMQSGLSAILNSIDGLLSLHGRIMIMTTNHPEKLDDALIRPGRIDLKMEIAYVNMEELRMFCRKFYGIGEYELDGLIGTRNHVAPAITMAALQNDFLAGHGVRYVIDRYIR